MIGKENNWPSKVVQGVRLLFWTLVVSEPATFAAGFFLPLVGMKPEWLDYVTLIPAVAGILLLTGIVQATVDYRYYWAGKFLLIVGILEFAFRVAAVVFAFAFFENLSMAYVFGRAALNIIGPIALFAFLGSLFLKFGSQRMGMFAMIIGGALATCRLLFLFDEDIASLFRLGKWSHNTSLVLMLLGIVSEVVVGTAALVVLWRFTKVLPILTSTKCWRCGYDLTNAQGTRCPECGWAAQGSGRIEPGAMN